MARRLCFGASEQAITYEILPGGVLYKDADGAEFLVVWESISHIKDEPGKSVELWVDGHHPIVIPYNTAQFPQLMNSICEGMASSNHRAFKPKTFLLASFFLFSCFFATICGAIVLLFEVIAAGSAGYVTLAMALPLLFLFPFQTVGIALGARRIRILKPFGGRSIAYRDVKDVTLALRKQRYNASLVVLLELESGETLEFKQLKQASFFVAQLKYFR